MRISPTDEVVVIDGQMEHAGPGRHPASLPSVRRTEHVPVRPTRRPRGHDEINSKQWSLLAQLTLMQGKPVPLITRGRRHCCHLPSWCPVAGAALAGSLAVYPGLQQSMANATTIPATIQHNETNRCHRKDSTGSPPPFILLQFTRLDSLSRRVDWTESCRIRFHPGIRGVARNLFWGYKSFLGV